MENGLLASVNVDNPARTSCKVISCCIHIGMKTYSAKPAFKNCLLFSVIFIYIATYRALL
jgi:hypothetical protein